MSVQRGGSPCGGILEVLAGKATTFINIAVLRTAHYAPECATNDTAAAHSSPHSGRPLLLTGPRMPHVVSTHDAKVRFAHAPVAKAASRAKGCYSQAEHPGF